MRSGARIPTSENPRSLNGRNVKLENSSKVQVSPRGLKFSFHQKETASILSSAPVNNSQDVFCLFPPSCIVARPRVISNKEHISRGWNFSSIRYISSGMNIKETKFHTFGWWWTGTNSVFYLKSFDMDSVQVGKAVLGKEIHFLTTCFLINCHL